MSAIYLDHNATTPLRPEVAEAMHAAASRLVGNPSSTHRLGAQTRAAIERARVQVASLVGADPAEVIFTSCATEANATAIVAACADASPRRRELLVGAADHASILESAAAWEERGWSVVSAPVARQGGFDPDALRAQLSERTALVSLLWANNETGAIHPIAELCAAAKAEERAAGPWIHVDAVQAAGKLPLAFGELGLHSLSLSAHKLNGPKGVGALVLARGVPFVPFLRGGPQERGHRAGTENLLGIIGFGVACALAEDELAARAERYAALRDQLWAGISKRIAGTRRNGDPHSTLCNTLNVTIDGVDGAVLLEALDLEGVCVSAGAACASGSSDPSHVLLAMGLGLAEARASLRFSVGVGVDERQIERVIALLPDLVQRVRGGARQ